jgi:hypothetical protein
VYNDIHAQLILERATMFSELDNFLSQFKIYRMIVGGLWIRHAGRWVEAQRRDIDDYGVWQLKILDEEYDVSVFIPENSNDIEVIEEHD